MASPNRSRLEVALGNGWREFSRPLAHADMLGTVTLNGERGALIRRHVDGIYCLCVHGRMTRLHERKVESAIHLSRQEGNNG